MIVGNLPVRSLVVFVQNNTSHIKANNVIALSSLRKTLRYGENILSVKQMKTVYESLLSKNKRITTKEHVRNIKNNSGI